MLLSSAFDASPYNGEQFSYSTVETLLDDMSKSMATPNLTRKFSRGSNGHRTGGSMRGVSKTTSATNSPRSSMLGRRKTLMTDTYRRRPVMVDQGTMMNGMSGVCDGLQAPLQTSRPVSWHPSTQMAPQASYHSYPMLASCDFPPTPAVCSDYASPVSTFSPLSQPFVDLQNQQQLQYADESSFFPTTTYEVNTNLYAPYQPSTLRNETENQHFSQDIGDMDSAMYSHFDWNNFVSNGFNSATAPPTPDNFLPIQHPSPSFEISEPTPYTLDDPESDDEPLIGMGLYDTPEKFPPSDPHLDNYRAQMMAQLLGPAYRKHEPTGKGLKLEETWNPPASEDGEDDIEGDDEDAEGSEADEDSKETTAEAAAEYSTSYNHDAGLVMSSSKPEPPSYNNNSFHQDNSWL